MWYNNYVAITHHLGGPRVAAHVVSQSGGVVSALMIEVAMAQPLLLNVLRWTHHLLQNHSHQKLEMTEAHLQCQSHEMEVTATKR